jgi:cellulose synthase operon protein C
MNRRREAQLAMAALVALGAANDLERATLATRGSRSGLVAVGAFGSAEFEAASALGPSDPAAALLSACAEAVLKLHPGDIARHGLSSRDRLAPRTGHPLQQVADRVAAIFGVEEFQLYVQNLHASPPSIELTDPVSLVVPAYLANLPEPQQVFLLARSLAVLAWRLYPVEVLGPQELELTLAAAARSAIPDYGAERLDAPYLGDHAKRLQKALSRRARRATEEAAPGYASARPPNIADFVWRVRLSAARAALVLADDLPGSIALVRKLEGDLSGQQGEGLARGIRLMNDLMRYWISEPSFALRERLGLL